MTDGTVIAGIPANAATDAAGNGSSASTSADNTVTYDGTAPTVTINQATGRADPANGSPINFTVVLSETVSDFATGDVTLSGTAGATTATVTGSGSTYNVAVSGMTGNGTVIAAIAASASHDAAGNGNTASTSTDNAVIYDATGPSASSVAVSPDPATAPPTVTASVSDAATGGSNITNAEFLVDSVGANGSGTAMNASDGSFSSATEGVTATLSSGAFSALTLGSHTIYVHGKDAAGNWGATASATFTKQATTTFTADPAEGTFGGTVNLKATLTSGGSELSGKTVSFKLNGTSAGSATTDSSGVAELNNASLSGINAGTYATGVEAGFAGETNYVASNGSAQLKVNKATPAFSALAGPTIVYGETPTALSGTIQAGSLVPPGNVSITVNGVTQSVSINSSTGNFSSSFTTGSLGVAGSPYTIVPALVDPNSKLGNYSVTINDGTMTVTKASLTVTAGDAAREYGAANPSFTGTVTGVENGDNITATYSSAAAASSPVGAYPIALALVDPDSKLGNYSVTIKNGTLTINNATPVITWSNPAGITYGTALNGGQLNPTANVGGTFTYTPASGTVLGAGNNQNLRADFVPSDSANYSNASKDVKINVSKATLTVAADAKLKIYGAAMPELTASFSGFVNGDTLAASVTGSPSLATTATASCAVGSYPIAATQGTLAAANYGFSFVNGTLAVTKAGTTTSVISSLNPSNLGQPVTFTATVSNSGATLTGTVQFKIDGANFGLTIPLAELFQ